MLQSNGKQRETREENTELVALKELSSVRCDVALVPVGGTYTMTAKEAAKLINEIRPLVAIPTHYGSIVGKPEDADVFRKYVDPEITVETRL